MGPIEGDPAPDPTPVATATPTPVATGDLVAPIRVAAAAPAPATTPAALQLRVIADRAARARGVAVRLRAPEDCRLEVRVRFAGRRAVARRASVTLRAGVARTVRVRLTPAAQARLRQARQAF